MYVMSYLYRLNMASKKQKNKDTTNKPIKRLCQI
jgi:hypothetical protein